MNKGGVSPKLKATMKKIENILRKEDIAGNIILGDGHGNFHQLVINKAQILLNDDIEKRLDGKEFS